MAKRKSEEPLETLAALTSPASKKVRVEDIQEDDPRTNGVRHLDPEQGEYDERRRNNTLAVADGDQERDEIAEVRTPESGSEDEEDRGPVAPLRQNAPTEGYSDLYLDTINRSVLDFDFEKLCSVSLSNINVYACLVCGRYFQGRGPKSHAYFHALEVGHHVYVNMETKKVYVLPEGYEVRSKSLEDIKYVVDPKFTEEQVKKLDKVAEESTDLSNKRYRPGYIGMNNIKANDYLNVVVQTLAHVAPIRNFFLLHAFESTAPQLPIRFSTLVRKIWNPKAFRNHVSPHELLQEIALRSSKRFTLTNQSDPVEFLSWFLNNLHLTLGGSKTKLFSSIIQKTFQGKLRMESQAITARSDTTGDRLRFEESSTITSNVSPYLILTLDLPPTPLFRDAIEAKNIIPQVPLTTLLQKYSGLHASEKQAHRIRHRLLHPLPPYLLFHIKRFSVNKFVSERNPTIVTFPSPRGLDMSPFVEPNPAIHPPGESIYYEMVANVILDASLGSGRGGEDSNAADAANKAVGGEGEHVAWKVQIRDKAAAVDPTATGLPEWLEIQDLWVQRAEAETLFTREGYLMVWERRKMPAKAKQKARMEGNGVGDYDMGGTGKARRENNQTDHF
jgi:U4/U6.U5 tri-snRNP-associated protein 2